MLVSEVLLIGLLNLSWLLADHDVDLITHLSFLVQSSDLSDIEVDIEVPLSESVKKILGNWDCLASAHNVHILEALFE